MEDLPVLWSAIIVLAGLGAVFGISLAMAARFFRINEDPRIETVYEALPHIDCGACGYPGCRAYAEAVVKGVAGPSECVPGGHATAEALARLMGLDAAPQKVRKVAVLKCGGREVADRFEIVGINECVAASLLHGGQKECIYGCLGFGTCADVCPVDAIVMEDSFPRVIEDKCIACGNCVRSCPKKLYELRPVTNQVYVACSSHDKGAVVRKICKVGCIACKKCEKVCPVGAANVDNFLSYIDPNVCDNRKLCVEACPTKCIIDRSAKTEPVAAELKAEA